MSEWNITHTPLILLIMGEKSGMNANYIQKQDIAKN